MHDFAFNRPQPGKWQSALLAAGMHLLLGLLLFYSVRWQTSKPAAVQVELVSALPPIQAPARTAPPPKPVVQPPPKPVVEPPPPPPAPKPDIAIKEPPKPKPVPKVEPKPEPRSEPKPKPVEKPPEPKVEPKPKPRPEPPPPDTRREQASQDRMLQEALARESAQMAQREAAREAEMMARVAAEGARLKAVQTWADRISARVRNNLVLPPGASGNPEALVSIALLPDGSVVGEPRMKRSTGNAALDTAILRAIVKSSPLPKPDDPSAFQRNVDLIFRPLEQ
jgi:colicin import membrane protein